MGLEKSLRELRVDKISDGDKIFVQRNMVDVFFTNILPKIDKEIILLTHNGDTPIGSGYNKFLSKKIKKWWVVNNTTNNPKIGGLPIGLQNKNLYRRDNPQGCIDIIKEMSKRKVVENNGVLMTFQTKTNPDHRKPIYDFFKNKTFITERKYNNDNRKDKKFIEDYLLDIKKHRFVLCPWGNGYDCHRNWEVLYMGSIPIIKKHPSLSYYENLPVWLIDDWSEVTIENMNQKYKEIMDNTYDLNKLYVNYWEEKINMS